MRKLFVVASAAALFTLPALAADGGAAGGAIAGGAAGAVVGGPVGAAVGAGVGAVAGDSASGPDRRNVTIEQRGSTTGSVGCSSTTTQTRDATGTTTQRRTDC